MSNATLDLDARYSVAGYGGIAFYLIGYVKNEQPQECEGHPDDDEFNGPSGVTFYCDGSCNEPCMDDDCDACVDRSMVRAVMVGDDREHEIDVDDLTPLDDEDYCSCCGQIGCGWTNL